jgi:hypothetical protein
LRAPAKPRFVVDRGSAPASPVQTILEVMQTAYPHYDARRVL